MPSGPNQMYRYRRIDVTDEGVIDEFNCIEQICKKVSILIRIKL